jgi:membrane protein YdbS with pleckstrin-like domain
VIDTPLVEGEKTLIGPVYRHWYLLAKWSGGPAALLAFVIAVNLTLNFWLDIYYQYVGARSGLPDPRLSPVLPELRLAFTLLVLAIAGFWFISLWVTWSAKKLRITDYRVIIDSGVSSHDSHVVGVDRILDVSAYQTPTGRAFNFGEVKINGADLGLDYIPDPHALAENIFITVTRLRKGLPLDGSDPEKKDEKNGADGALHEPARAVATEEILEQEAAREAHQGGATHGTHGQSGGGEEGPWSQT